MRRPAALRPTTTRRVERYQPAQLPRSSPAGSQQRHEGGAPPNRAERTRSFCAESPRSTRTSSAQHRRQRRIWTGVGPTTRAIQPAHRTTFTACLNYPPRHMFTLVIRPCAMVSFDFYSGARYPWSCATRSFPLWKRTHGRRRGSAGCSGLWHDLLNHNSNRDLRRTPSSRRSASAGLPSFPSVGPTIPPTTCARALCTHRAQPTRATRDVFATNCWMPTRLVIER
jgi:hypothetical protein